MHEFMSIFNTAISKYYSQTVGKTLHMQSYLSHFDPRWMDSPTSQKKANPNMKQRTHLSNIQPTTSVKDSNHWTHSEGKFINYNIPLPRIYIVHVYLCILRKKTYHTQKLNGWLVFVNIYCNTFVESTLPSRYRTLIDWLIDWLIDCLVDCMMLRVVEHKCAKLFCIVFFMWKAWYGNKKRFRNPCLMTLRNTDADIKDSRIMNFSLKFTFLLQQAYIHNPFFLNHKEFIKRKILNNLNRSFMFKTLYFSDVRYP